MRLWLPALRALRASDNPRSVRVRSILNRHVTMRMQTRRLGLPLLSLLVAAPVMAQQSADDVALLARAKAIHARVLSLDTHVDIAPTNFNVDGPNYTQRLPRTQVDLVKMEEGGLGGVFLAVYVGQSANLDSAGFARANAMSSATDFAGTAGFTASISGTEATTVTGMKSFNGS